MKPYVQLHHEAMAAMDDYFMERQRGEYAKTKKLLEQAFELEARAARAVPEENEPTRSIILRSAASIALIAGKVRDAHTLIATALSGNPPQEIKLELCELLLKMAKAGEMILPDEPLAPGTVIQTLTIRRATNRNALLPIHLVNRVQEFWASLYEQYICALFDVSVELLPVRARPGSWTVDLRLNVEDEHIAQAFEALAKLSLIQHGNLVFENAGALSLATLRSMLGVLIEYDASLEIRMFRAEQPEPSGALKFEAPTPELMRSLDEQAARYVDSRDIPQADDLDKIFQFVDIVKQGGYPSPDNLEVVPRQISYYRRAAEILGYLEEGALLPAGEQIAALKRREDRLRSAVVHFEASKVGRAWIRWSKVDSLLGVTPDFNSVNRFLEEVAVGLSAVTIARRARTLMGWCQQLSPYHYQKYSLGEPS